MTKLSKTETTEIRRMLLSFKAGLPDHHLDEWRVVSQPEPAPTVVEDSTPANVWYGDDGLDWWRVSGHGTCSRCRREFPIPGTGNFATISEEDIGETVEEAKRWVRSIAAQDGPCWGDVPTGPDDRPRPW